MEVLVHETTLKMSKPNELIDRMQNTSRMVSALCSSLITIIVSE